MFWAIYHKPTRGNIHATLGNARFYTRVLGPQVRVINGGAGAHAAMVAVDTLDAAGIAVTDVTQSKEPSVVSKVYYRGERAKPAAEAVSAALPGELQVQELKKLN